MRLWPFLLLFLHGLLKGPVRQLLGLFGIETKEKTGG